MRHRPFARRTLDLDLTRRKRDGFVRQDAKTRDRAGSYIQHAARAVEENEAGNFRDVVDIDMIAAFLAFTEEDNCFAAIGLAAEFVGPVAAMWIAGTIDERRPQYGQWCCAAHRQEHLLARKMHCAMQTHWCGR